MGFLSNAMDAVAPGLSSFAKDGAWFLNGGNMDSYLNGSWGASLNLKNSRKLMEDQFGYNLALQQDSQNWSAAQAELSRKFDERMSNSAYQRVVKDLRKANINPMLAINNGAASSPSAPMPAAGTNSVSPGPMTFKGGELGSTLSGAASLMSGFGSIAKLGSEVSVNNAHAANLEADTGLKAANTAMAEQNIRESQARSQMYVAQTNLANKRAGREQAEAKQPGVIGQGVRAMQNTANEWMENVKELGGNIGSSVEDLWNSAKTSVERFMNTRQHNRMEKTIDIMQTMPRLR